MSSLNEALKNAGLSHEEVQAIIEAENEFDAQGELYEFSQVQHSARKKLFSSQNSSHVSA